MIIEYSTALSGAGSVMVWRAFTPRTDEYLYVGPSYSVWMVPGYECFHGG